MVKAVFTTKVMPTYKDRPEELYHFKGSRHLSLVLPTVGDRIIYYEPRIDTDDDNSRGGRSSYVAMARVESVVPDIDLDGYYYANIVDYIDFPTPVHFRGDGTYLEHGLQKEDGNTDAAAFRQSVRHISDGEFYNIIAAGFGTLISPSQVSEAPFDDEWDEALNQPFDRPLVELTSIRPFRQQAFKKNVRAAYGNRCAVTGLRILDRKGLPEVQAAHIRPVNEAGSDSVRNGLALSSTVHWMFDRGLIAIDSDLTILTATRIFPQEIAALIVPDGKLRLPHSPAQHPYVGYLEYHRDRFFVG